LAHAIAARAFAPHTDGLEDVIRFWNRLGLGRRLKMGFPKRRSEFDPLDLEIIDRVLKLRGRS
jgi:hypothetical protein